MIAARVRKRFPARAAYPALLLDLELQAGPGVTVLFGPSGAGKSLLLDCLAGFIQPDDGRIMLDNRLLFDAPTNVHLPPQRRNCGYVMQRNPLFPHLTLRENLVFAVAEQPRLERHRRVSEMLDRFGLAQAAGQLPRAVSPLERRRCAIARALLRRPGMLLVDEPAQGLDSASREDLLSSLRTLREAAATPVLLATTDLAACFEVGARMLMLHSGQIIQRGVPRRVSGSPASVEAARLLGIYNILEMEILTLDPQQRTSTLRYRGVTIQGPYFPGRLKKDRVTVCILPSEVLVSAREGSPRANCIPCTLTGAREMHNGVRLEFEEGLRALLPLHLYDLLRNTRDWQVELPALALRLIEGNAETI